MRWILAFVLFVSFLRPAEPCAIAPPHGKEAEVAEEEAVIVWDADHHTEHFIRKAAFRTNADAIGFLVPTPTTPELGEVNDGMFAALARQVAPQSRIERTGFEPGCTCIGAAMKGDAAPGPSIAVIQTARVAGFDATTLAATSPSALASWLGAHGFEQTPALTAWLDRYVTDHWRITAFVVAADPNQGGDLATRSVRMSFSTERPFYPYREPEQRTTILPRSLRVYVLSSHRYDATFADKPWVATPFYADTVIVPGDLARLAGNETFVTAFLDTSSPRLGTDEVFFQPSSDDSVLHQPDQIMYRRHEVPLEIIPLGLLVCGVGWTIWRRRRRS